MNKSSSVLTNRLSDRTLFANIVEQKKGVRQGLQLKVFYVNDHTNDIIVNRTEGASETTVEEYNGYNSSALPPDPPSMLFATSASGEVLLTFTPGSDGGSPITNYQYSLDGGITYSAFSPATGAIDALLIRGLTNGVTYSIRLRAVNAAGPSSLESDIIYVTPMPGNRLMLLLDGLGTDLSGATWYDKSGKANNGALVNEPLWTADNSGYYAFNGVDQYVTLGDGFADFSGGITVLTFVNFGSSVDTWERIIDFGNGQQNDNIIFARQSDTSNLRFQYYDGVGGTLGFDEGLEDNIVEGGWGFYAARLDGSRYLLKNHLADVSGDFSGLPNSVLRTSNFIGHSNWTGDSNFEGNIGIVALYGSALSDEEIGQFFDLYKRRYFNAPAAPTDLSGIIGDGVVGVSFSAGSDGGFPIGDYLYSINDGFSYSSSGVSSSPIYIGALANGTAYTISLKAVNGIGESDPSASITLTPGRAPDAPTDLAGTIGNGSVSVSFSAGADGGYAVTDYLYSTNGGTSYVSAGTTASPIVITGLANGTAYTIRLKAVNAIGASAQSSSIVATPATVPGAPTSVTAAGGNQIGIVSFTAPASNGGSAITAYTATSSPGGFTGTSSSSPVTVTGLTNGTAYTFTVIATNAIGDSVASAASNSATPAEAVEGPTITFGYPKDKGIILNLTTPTYPVGYTVSNYDYSTDGGATYTTLSPADNSSPLLIPGLTPLTAYNLKLKARFSNSQISAPSNTYSFSTKKRQIIDTMVASGSWTAPADISWCQYLVVGAGGGGGASYSDVEVLGNVPFVASNPGGLSYWINSTAGTFYGYMYKGASRYNSTKPVRMTVVDSGGNPIVSTITPNGTTYIYNKFHPGEIVYWSIGSGMPNVSNYFSPYTINSERSNNISSGGGGGAGGRVRYTIGTNIQAVTPTTTYNVVVGAGGAGGVGSAGAEGDGQAGGTTLFDTIDCSGGSGGRRSKDGNTNPQDGYGKGGTGGLEGSNFFSGQGGSGLLAPFTNSNYDKYKTADPGGQAWYVDFDENGAFELYATGGPGGIPNTVSAVTAAANSGIGGSGTGSTLNSFASGRAGASGVVKIKYYIDRDPTVPDAPTGVSAIGGNGQATVSFSAPGNNGDLQITSYTVTSSPGGITAKSFGSPVTIGGLTNGTAYTFTVVATNGMGDSSASSASNSVTPA